MNSSQVLFRVLRIELHLAVPKDAYMERTYAGRHQKSAGAYSSVIHSKSNPLFEIGLYQPIVNLLKCPNLEHGHLYGNCVDCGCKGKCKGAR